MNKIAVYGFGRMGRSTLKAALRQHLLTPAVISDIKDLPTLAALFAYDSNYGEWLEPVKAQNNTILIAGKRITYVDARQGLPDWKSLNVKVVIDCTGQAIFRDAAAAHLTRGASRVLIADVSQSRADCDAVLLPGVNLDAYDPQSHRLISLADGITNALATLIAVLKENFGIESGFFSTIQPYTSTQSLTDQAMQDRRTSWAANENIIPASLAAVKALQFIWPNLPITGKAYRVPVRTGSIAELNVILERPTNTEQVRNVFRAATRKAPLKGILGVLEEEYASSRVVGESLSALVDLPLLQVENGWYLSIAVWYDNEMGYANRLAETAAYLVSR
jgi:glyceraldehyde 3-phosphate dehydrogenase